MRFATKKRVMGVCWRFAFALACGLVMPMALSAELLPPMRSFSGVREFGLGVSPVALQGLSQGDTGWQSPAWVGIDGKARQKETLRSLFFPEVVLGANGTTRSLAKAYFSGSGTTQQSIENFLKEAQNQQTPYGYFEISPTLSMLRLQMGLFARVEVDGYVWSAADTQGQEGGTLSSDPFGGSVDGGLFGLVDSQTHMLVRAEILRGVRLAFSVPYKNTGVHLGLQVRPTWRSEFDGHVSLAEPLATEAAKELKSKFNESHGVPVDAAVTVRLPRVKLMPMVGLLIRDVADTHFRASKSGHQDLIQKSNIQLGASAWLLRGKSAALQCTFAAENLGDSRVSGLDRLGAGCEAHIRGRQEADLVLDAPVIMRLGWNPRGLAYGLQWYSPLAQLEVGSGVSEVDGPEGFSARQDRRYFLKLTIDVAGS